MVPSLGKRVLHDLAPGLVGLALAVPLALVLTMLHDAAGEVRRGIAWCAAFLLAIFLLVLGAYLGVVRRSAKPWRVGFVAIACMTIILCAIYFYWVSPILALHADFLIWSESMFVNDIIKLRTGVPLYTPAGEHASFIYTPGAPVLTYALASSIGQGTSIPTYRFIQLLYLLGACAIAVLATRRLIDSAGDAEEEQGRLRWGLLWLPLFLLVATNALTNPYTSHLHNSSLELLLMALAYWLVLEHSATRSRAALLAMMILPGLGYMVKQSFSIWAGLFSIHVVFFCRELPIWKRLAFPLASFGGVALAMGAFYLAWGEDYLYWTSVVVGARGQAIDLMRSVDHALAVWPYFALGFLGAAFLFRRHNLDLILGPWVLWLILVSIEAYTNGVAWMKHHLGAGSLIATIWFMALLARYWPLRDDPKSEYRLQQWLRAAVATVIFAFLLHGMGALRVPMEPYPMRDLHRYIHAIEAEVANGDPATTLLDIGAWNHLPLGIVTKDSAIPIGDQGMSLTTDFAEIKQRLSERRYSKIMVRNLEETTWWYDHEDWPRSSGIKEALLANYREARVIPAVELGIDERRYYSQGKISILVPKE
jgi:hypothetical protein